MKKIVITLTISILFTFSTSYSYAYSEQVDKKWSNEDLYLFSALVSSQIADYTQSLKFNSIITKNECGMLDTPNIYVTENGATITRWIECTEKKYLMGEEKNPLVRRADGGFDNDRALLLGAGLDVGLFYIGTKYPKWRRLLLHLVYTIEMIAINNNHARGFGADTPVFPIFFTYNF